MLYSQLVRSQRLRAGPCVSRHTFRGPGAPTRAAAGARPEQRSGLALLGRAAARLLAPRPACRTRRCCMRT